MKKIALIGAGELGSRHLQSLGKCAFPVSLQVVDPSEKSLEISKKRFREIPENSYVKKIEFITSIEKLDNELDLVIVATSSNVRLKILQELLEQRQKIVRNMILEKVLFQSVTDLHKANSLLKSHGVKSWVNCPKRSFESIKQIKVLCASEAFLDCQVVGNNWGLLCNSIHFIDMMAFILNTTNYQISTERLIKKIHHSKRAGFIEMFGTLEMNFPGMGKLTLTSNESEQVSFISSFETKNLSLILDEKVGKLQISHKKSGQKEELLFKHPFQSEMTATVAKAIIFEGQCELTSFEESAKFHEPFLTALIDVYEELSKSTSGYIPIT